MTSISSQSDRIRRQREKARPAGAAPPLPRAKKRLGQHFLTDRNILRRIAEAADIGRDATVIEVGAGPGDLTAELASRARVVVAVELDETLAERLRERFDGTNVRVVQGDVLAFSPGALLAAGGATAPYIVVGNLPFYIASAVVRRFLEGDVPPERLVVMVQREVAEHMTAGPGRMTLLSVAVQTYGEARRLFTVPPGAFRPPPKVHSTVVRIDVSPEPRVPLGRECLRDYFEVVRAGFSAPRKRIRNALAQGLGIDPIRAEAMLRRAGIDPGRRPAELSLEDWASLTRAYREGAA